jgi:hypothetical protein
MIPISTTMYLRSLTEAGGEYPLAIRINAHFGVDESKDASFRNKRFMAANDAIYNFKESPCIAWSAYCGPNGKAQT